MNILINASNLKTGGGSQVADSFISCLHRYGRHRFFILLSDELSYLSDRISRTENCRCILYNLKHTVKGAWWGRNKELDRIVESCGIQAVFTIFGPSLWRPRVLHVCGFARPQIVYPESPFFRKISGAKYLKYKLSEFVKLRNFDRSSDVLVTENGDVSERLSRKIRNKRIYTVTNYYNQIFDNPSDWANDIRLPEFDGITLLTITACHPHKNVDIVYKIVDYLESNRIDLNVRFVLTLTEKEFPLTDKYRKYVRLVGRVRIAQCPHLYEQADVMFLPTLLECFSASYPEAMRMGVPILTSDLPFARALCGDAAVYCNPLSAESIVEKLRLLRDAKVRDELCAKGKIRLGVYDTFDTRAEKYIDIIEKNYRS